MLILQACATLGGRHSAKEAPKLTLKTPINEVLDTAIEYGGQSMAEANEIITYRKQWPMAGKLLREAMERNVYTYDTQQMVHGFQLYVRSGDGDAVILFDKFARLSRPEVQRLAWSLAAAMPSANMKIAIERRLDEAVKKNDLKSLAHYEFAKAIRDNKIKTSYTVVREVFYITPELDFAKAMSEIDPEQATSDFLDYLSRVTFEEVRQIHFTSVDLIVAAFAFEHMSRYKPDLSHPAAATLFYYSVSRNRGIAEAAFNLILSYVPEQKEILGFMLASTPTPVQLAFVENARVNMTPQSSMLLKSLRYMTARQEVIEELRALNI